MDPREYARHAYVHHRAKASAYHTAGDETRAVGHARRAEIHRAAAFGLPIPAQIGLGVGGAVVGAAGLGYLGRRAYKKRSERLAMEEEERLSKINQEARKANLEMMRQEDKPKRDAYYKEKKRIENERRAKELAASEELERQEKQRIDDARAALRDWYKANGETDVNEQTAVDRALTQGTGFEATHGEFTFRVEETTVLVSRGGGDRQDAQQGSFKAEAVKLVATRGKHTHTLGWRRTG
jgi:flagellar biosynthesis GTPase FlhF